MGASADERFWSKVDKRGPGECWNWTASKRRRGYGSFYYNGRTRPAHRVSYEWVHGPVDPKLDIDHLCRNPSCVNPAHLEAVTHQENIMRGPRERYGANRDKTHCPQGHPYTPPNLYVSFRGHRFCRRCINDWKNEKRARDNRARALLSSIGAITAMTVGTEEICGECGLPIVECSALAAGRLEAERWLRDEGYSGLRAKQRAKELIPRREASHE